VDPPSCFGIKYVKLEPGQANEDPRAKIAKRVLEHEIEVMLAVKNAVTLELHHHCEQYVGSLLPDGKTPVLFTEFIDGDTLSTDIKNPDINDNAVSYYLLTLFVLEELSRMIPGFTHGDMNPGNIFLIKREGDHPECRFTVADTSEEGDYMETVYKFKEMYTIKLIDFGLSECERIQWGTDHPSSPSESLVGVWQLDAWMSLESFLNVASEIQTALLKDIASKFFGPELAGMLQMKDVAIYNYITDLKACGTRAMLYNLCNEATGKKHTTE